MTVVANVTFYLAKEGFSACGLSSSVSSHIPSGIYEKVFSGNLLSSGCCASQINPDQKTRSLSPSVKAIVFKTVSLSSFFFSNTCILNWRICLWCQLSDKRTNANLFNHPFTQPVRQPSNPVILKAHISPEILLKCRLRFTRSGRRPKSLHF